MTPHHLPWTFMYYDLPTLSKSDFSAKPSDEHFKSTVSSNISLDFRYPPTSPSKIWLPTPNPQTVCKESVVDANPESTKTTFSVSFSCTLAKTHPLQPPQNHGDFPFKSPPRIHPTGRLWRFSGCFRFRIFARTKGL